MSHKRQKPKKRKAYGGRPQKIHKINGRSTHQDLTKHIKMLQAQGKLTEAINNGELNNDTIPDLIKETVTGIYRMTATVICLKGLLKERTIGLIPGFTTMTKEWDRQLIRFEENANAYLVLKDHQVKTVETDSVLSDEEKAELMKDDSSLSDIVWDLVDCINELFINHATKLADVGERFSSQIDEYIKDHVLENETPNDFAVRVVQAYIVGIREEHRTNVDVTDIIPETQPVDPLNEAQPNV